MDEISDEKSTSTTKSKGKGKQRQGPQDLLERKWRNTHNIGTLQLLALIRDKVGEEEPVLTFPYFAMHQRSMEILRLIRDKEHHKFVQYFTAQYMPDDSFISNIVYLIHHVARGSAQNAAQLRLGGEPASRIVMSCGDVMRTYLDKNGDAACKYLRTSCKNKSFLDVEVTGESDQNTEAEEGFLYWIALEEVLGAGQMESLRTGIPQA